jgi:3D (Asp-Asp-Asp) domain-containing protein
MGANAERVARVHVPDGTLVIGPPFSLGLPPLGESFTLPGRFPADPFWVAQSIRHDPIAIWRLRGVWDRLGMPMPVYRLTDDALAVMVAQAVGQGQLDARLVPTARSYTCTLTPRRNTFNDLLPIIPADSRVQQNKLLFQLTFDAHLANIYGDPAIGRTLALGTANPGDTIAASGPTDVSGNTTVVLKTREQGAVAISSDAIDLTVALAPLTIGEAWFENPFQVTGYNVCDEADFTGAPVAGNGLAENHREDFLFGARGVPMQGTGRGSNGRLIRLASMTGGWHRNAHGHVDHVNNRAGVTFSYTDAVHGAFAVLRENLSAAVDPTVIPPHAQFDVAGVGLRRADDRGSAIVGHHIDNFLGFGAAVVRQWLARGITQANIRFLRY